MVLDKFHNFIIKWKDWTDLIEYVLHKVLNSPQEVALPISPSSLNVELSMTQKVEEEFW